MTLVFTQQADGSVTGSLTFGTGSPPAPPTSGTNVFPPGFDGDVNSVPFPYIGFPYTATGVSFDGPRLQLGIVTNELWKTWCGLQTSFDGPDTTRVVWLPPELERYGVDDGHRLVLDQQSDHRRSGSDFLCPRRPLHRLPGLFLRRDRVLGGHDELGHQARRPAHREQARRKHRRLVGLAPERAPHAIAVSGCHQRLRVRGRQFDVDYNCALRHRRRRSVAKRWSKVSPEHPVAPAGGPRADESRLSALRGVESKVTGTTVSNLARPRQTRRARHKVARPLRESPVYFDKS